MLRKMGRSSSRGPPQCFFTPRIPVYRVVGVLFQVRAGFVNQAIGKRWLAHDALRRGWVPHILFIGTPAGTQLAWSGSDIRLDRQGENGVFQIGANLQLPAHLSGPSRLQANRQHMVGRQSGGHLDFDGLTGSFHAQNAERPSART